jgi:hypothetical protein
LKAAIVKSSVLAAHNSWAASTYVGSGGALEERIIQTRKQVREALIRYRRAQADLVAEKARVAELIAAGKVIPIA